MTFSSEPPRLQRFALAACMFLTTATFGFLQPFVPLYLQAAGLSRAQIGLVVGVGTGTTLLVQPLLGRLSDRLDARRPIVAGAAAVAALAYSAYRFAPAVTQSSGGEALFVATLVFTLLTALGINGFTYLNVVGGVLVGRMARTQTGAPPVGAGAAYARYRVWGSVGYILVALLTGWLVSRGAGPRSGLSRADLDPAFAWGPLLFGVIAAISCLVPDGKSPHPPPLPPSGQGTHAGGTGEPGTNSGSVRREAEAAPAPGTPVPRRDRGRGWGPLRPFLVAFFLYQFALYGASAYLSLFLQTLGASPLAITTTFAAGVVCEVLVMTQVGRLTDVYGRRPALGVAFLLMPVRLLLYIPAPGPAWVLAVQTLHGLNFGIMGAIAIAYVNDLATDADRGTLQARLGAAGGLATALGPVVCGLIADGLGIGWMFAAMAFVGAVGAVVFVWRVPESHPAPALPAEHGPRLLRPVWRWLGKTI